MTYSSEDICEKRFRKISERTVVSTVKPQVDDFTPFFPLPNHIMVIEW